MSNTQSQGIALAPINLEIQHITERMLQANTNRAGDKAKLPITTKLLQTLQNHILFVDQPLEDPYDHLQNFAHMCRDVIGTQHPSMDVVGLQIFLITLTGNVAIWYSEHPQDVITSWVELQRAFLAKFFIRTNRFKMRDNILRF